MFLGSTPIYNYSLTFAPNGNVLSANDSVNGNWNYSYDQFNRLAWASTSSNTACAFPPTGTPSFNYVYDRFGNRWQQNSPAGSIYTSSFTFTGNATNNNNRMDLYSYDSAGNLLYDNLHHYFYDAENHLIQVDGTLPFCTSNGASGSAAAACYYYDAEGRRVFRTGYTADNCDNTGKRGYVFDLAGHVIVENNNNDTGCTGQVYLGDRHFGRQGGGSFFYHSDWLGTVRMIISDQYLTGGEQTCTSLPFGDGLTCNSNYGNVWHFTGKERDSESGLDDFDVRYYSSSLGRFMRPDPAQWAGFEHKDDPQAWNGYAYGRNNPLLYTDPDGANYTVCDVKGKNCADLTDDQYKQFRQDNPNLRVTPSGDIYTINENGTETKTGSASYYNEKDVAAAQMLVTTGSTLSDPRTFALWYGGSAIGGFALYGAGIFEGGFTALELGGEQLLTNQAAGQIIGWGTGQAGTQATEQLTQNLTKEAVQEMIKKGLNKATVDGLKNQYARAAAEGGAKMLNQQLLPRLALMEKIIQLWPK